MACAHAGLQNKLVFFLGTCPTEGGKVAVGAAVCQHTEPLLSILAAPQPGLWPLSELLCFPACPEDMESGKKLWSPGEQKQGAVPEFGLPVLSPNISCGGYPS